MTQDPLQHGDRTQLTKRALFSVVCSLTDNGNYVITCLKLKVEQRVIASCFTILYSSWECSNERGVLCWSLQVAQFSRGNFILGRDRKSGGTNSPPHRQNVPTQSVWDQSRILGTYPPTPLRANPYPNPAPIQSLNLTHGRQNGLSVHQLPFPKHLVPNKLYLRLAQRYSWPTDHQPNSAGDRQFLSRRWPWVVPKIR